MTTLKIIPTVFVLFPLLALPIPSLSEEPQGELYWMVDSAPEHITPQNTVSSYDPDDPPYDGVYTRPPAKLTARTE